MEQVFSFYLPSYLGTGFRAADFSSELIGTSDCNIYIPAYTIYGHELHTFVNEDNEEIEVMEYSIPKVINTGSRRYQTLFSNLLHAQAPNKFFYKLQGVDKSVNIHRGILYDNEGNILMCLGILTQYVLSTPTSTLTTTPDKNNFILFISNKFNEPQYKNLRKKVEIEYIDKVRAAGIDILETNKINDWLFKNNFKLPNFKSVIELNRHLAQEVPPLVLEA